MLLCPFSVKQRNEKLVLWAFVWPCAIHSRQTHTHTHIHKPERQWDRERGCGGESALELYTKRKRFHDDSNPHDKGDTASHKVNTVCRDTANYAISDCAKALEMHRALDNNTLLRRAVLILLAAKRSYFWPKKHKTMINELKRKLYKKKTMETLTFA
jgi:hypothetical protein